MNMQSEQNATSGDVKTYIKNRKKVLISGAPSLSRTGCGQNAKQMTYNSTLHVRPKVEFVEASAPIPATVAIRE